MAHDKTNKSLPVLWKIRDDEDPISKAETQAVRAVTSNAFEPEDEFQNLYLGTGTGNDVIQPPYNMRTLDRLSQENNALSPCIEAMVTNVDGTGFTIIKDAPGAKEADGDNQDPDVLKAWDFFNEPWPGESFITQRKRLRRDRKRTGNAYLEVIRNARDDILFTRHVDAKMVRICKLDPPMSQRVKVRRDGQDVTIALQVRYRKYVQILNGRQKVYFKEFGCPLDLNKNTGQWTQAGQRLGAQLRATEIRHYIDLPDAHTPYGVPCWIAQLPSVMGSRKAEELNMEFFDHGGVPPVLIILQGGVMAPESKKAIEQKMSGSAMKKNRVQVIEMEPTGGDLNSTPSAKVTVERFGAERQNDSMFEKYDEKCEIRVRRSFRLPPIFVGGAQEYSFATAFASYTVGEAQVFKPERDDFDEDMSLNFLPALGYPGLRMKSKPLVIEDATLKLQGIEIAQATSQVDASEVIDEVNATVGTTLKVSKTLPVPQAQPPQTKLPSVNTGGTLASKPPTPRAPQAGAPKQETKVTKPAATPRKQPAVTKLDGDTGADWEPQNDIERLALDTVLAIRDQETGAGMEALGDCFERIRALDDDEAEQFQLALAMVQGMILARVTEGQTPLPN